ncbi:hypothetical protein [Nitrospira sp. BLG_2]|uniref:hypothetical protein n=1 Tax=Nitrospira sp. BLG_2 TaxID=3397507 RepID=UPI003B990521
MDEVIEREPTEAELAEIEANAEELDELDRDWLLEAQELEDYENHYGPCDYDE